MKTSYEHKTFLPFAAPDITDAEVDAVVRVLRSGWLSTGPETRAFEEEFAAFVGAPHAVALNSCTAALHLALEALGVGPGDEVLTSTLTFTATAEVVEYLGGRSRFLDVDTETLNLTPAAVRHVVETEYVRDKATWRHRDSGGRLRAIVPVHYAGLPCDMDDFEALARDLGVALVDDAAHAFPAAWGGRRIGAFPCTTAYSFYATKTITTGEGGMLCTHDQAVADRVRMMSLHGISRDAWKRYTAEGSWYYEVVHAGFKYNMTDIAAALGRVQLHRAEAMRTRRVAIAARYQELLKNCTAVELPGDPPNVDHAWHLFPIRLHLEALTIDRSEFIRALKVAGIGTSVHFIPLHRQPFYASRYGYAAGDFPVAEAVYPRLVSLPIYSAMSDRDVMAVAAAVQELTDQYRPR